MKRLLLTCLICAYYVLALAQTAPKIFYTTPQTLTIGTNVTISPTNSGGTIPTVTYGSTTTFAGNSSGYSSDGTSTGAGFYNPAGIAADANGNIYVTDQGSNRIRKITPAGVVSTIAGGSYNGFADGTGTAALFNNPCGIAVDGNGNLFVADRYNNRIRKVTPAGVVSTFAGNGNSVSADGTGTAAGLYYPYGITVDANNNLFVTEQLGSKIRKITPAGVVTTIAGSGSTASINGTGTSASFYYPTGIAIDGNGNLFVADNGSNQIRKVTPAGVVTTLAGSGTYGFANGTGTAANFSSPTGISIDGTGNLYVADQWNYMIRMITPAGVVSTLAGSTTAGYINGVGGGASFYRPMGVAVLGDKLYVADYSNNLIRAVAITGYAIDQTLPQGLSFDNQTGIINGSPTVVSAAANYTITGLNAYGSSSAKISIASVIPTVAPTAIAFTPTSAPIGYTLTITGTNLLGVTAVNIGGKPATTFAAQSSTTIVATVPSGATSGNITITNSYGTATLTGFTSVAAPAISYESPQSYITGTTIIPLKPTSSGSDVPNGFYGQVSTFAGSGNVGSSNGIGAAASFNYPAGLAKDASGNIYVADQSNNYIRKITPDGLVSTFATGFNNPAGLTFDAAGNLYVAESGSHQIRKVTSTGVVSVFAGKGYQGNNNGTGTGAGFNYPSGIVADASGNLYVADASNYLIRKITPAGIVTTFAGSGTYGSVDGTGTSASFSNPSSIAIDGSGNLYVADNGTRNIRKITPDGVVSTIVKSIISSGYSNAPISLTADAAGNLYITNTTVVQKIASDGALTVIAGNITSSIVSSADGVGSAANFSYASGITIDGLGNLYVADRYAQKIKKVNIVGYTISSDLPDGLTMDNTGTITGIPVKPSVARDYVVTATNLAGNSNSNINIAITIPPVAPTISSVTPSSPASGSAIIINGNNFLGSTGVTIGAASVPFNIISPNKLSAVVNTTIAGDIKVTNSYGSANYTDFSIASSPIISYTTPQTYTVGTAINKLIPNNSGSVIPNTAYSQTTTLAGSGATGNANGAGTAATFNNVRNAVADVDGNVYVTDAGNNLIRKITPAGVVSTFAGSGSQGMFNGQGTSASFNGPQGIAIDGGGNLYVADQSNRVIRKITAAGKVTTFVGSGNYNSTDGVGTAASFAGPIGLSIDGLGNLYVTEEAFYNKIRKITPDGVVTTLAGGNTGSTNGKGTAASFYGPLGLACDASGNIYVADSYNNQIRKITPTGEVTTFAGSTTSGKVDGAGATASFNHPAGVSCDSYGNVYVADQYNNLIRKITPTGDVSTLAGSGGTKLVDGVGSEAGFSSPAGLVADGQGNLIIVDAGHNVIRKVAITGYTIKPALPKGLNFDGATGTISGTPTVSSSAITYTASGINTAGISNSDIAIEIKIPEQAPAVTAFSPVAAGTGNILTITGTNFTDATAVEIGGIAATNYYVVSPTIIKAIVAPGSTGTSVKVTNAYGNNGLTGFTFNSAPNISYKGPQTYQAGVAITPLTVTNNGSIVPEALYRQTTTFAGSTETSSSSIINQPSAVVQDASGNLYSADNYVIHKITPAGVVTVFAGSGAYGNTNGTGTSASFGSIQGMTIDKDGNIYVSDQSYNQIRKITPTGVVTTLTNNTNYGSDDGKLVNASFNYPQGMAIDDAGNLYIADGYNNKIRKISTDGIVSTFAGTGSAGAANGPANAATFNYPQSVAIDNYGNFYIADKSNHLIRKITPASIVSTLAGSGLTGKADGKGTAASFNNPTGITIDFTGNIYVADAGNHLIRKITPAGEVTTLAGTGVAALVNRTGTEASFNNPVNVLANAAGNLYVADKGNNAIRKISLTGYAVSPALPAGLALNGLGTISGTPTTISAAVNYSITASNMIGTSTAQLNIEVGVPPTAPTIACILPTKANAGTVITFTGTSFAGVTGVSIGGVSALSYTVLSPTSIIAVPAPTATSGSVSVTNAYGSATADGFTFIGPPQISYSSIPALTAGTTIKPITPTNNGTVIPANSFGKVNTVAGTGSSGSLNGLASAATFYYPFGVTTDVSGNIYVTDRNNSLIRKIDANGNVTTLAGTGSTGAVNGTGTAASFNFPNGIVSDYVGNLYVADGNNNLIRKITLAGVVTTFAGNGAATSIDGVGLAASFYNPTGITIDVAGNLYVTDSGSGKIRKITPDGTVTTVTGNGSSGLINNTGSSSFNGLSGIATDIKGNLYVADTYNNLIRKVSATGVVTVFAGSGTYSHVDGVGTSAGLAYPRGVVVDASGNLFITELNNYVRMITPDGVVSTIAGNGQEGTKDGVGNAASFYFPALLCLDQTVM
ncbi:hypothetical protein HH214_04750 [Mucilaginibacter robiniae]|uniref:Teneurin NHL domain-containing protein n=1 Tax=Mucilaginibacter robiniae TaxID=2728022 RepID=A0A7L5E366_9SPHI|nr:putative Ig domain-containing protein [Mucilaginibacter robiniae]QJD95233.1 hypothetical protein HH214_04750 [Mucilaginibacter robiniae]